MSGLIRRPKDCLEREIHTLVVLLDRMNELLNEESLLREQMQVAEVVGRTAIRLGELQRMQKQINLLGWAEERARVQVSVEVAAQAEALMRPSEAELESMKEAKLKRQKREWLARRLGLAPEDITDGMVFQAEAENSLF